MKTFICIFLSLAALGAEVTHQEVILIYCGFIVLVEMGFDILDQLKSKAEG